MTRLRQKLMTKGVGITLMVFTAGICFALVGSFVMHQTNRMEFCVSCHSMSVVFEEYQQSAHFKNASGVRATCSDCHVPRSTAPLLMAKIIAVKDVYHEMVGTIDTAEKFEARRWHLANIVWAKMAANDSRECRTCHEFSSMDPGAQGRRVGRKHQRAELQEKTCIDCHKGVAHVEPLPPI